MKTQEEDSRLRAEERTGAAPSLTSLRRTQSCQHLDFRLLAFRTEAMHCCCFSCPVCGTCDSSPSKCLPHGFITRWECWLASVLEPGSAPLPALATFLETVQLVPGRSTRGGMCMALSKASPTAGQGTCFTRSLAGCWSARLSESVPACLCARRAHVCVCVDLAGIVGLRAVPCTDILSPSIPYMQGPCVN